MSLIARWAATPRTWLREYPVAACTRVAAPPAIAIGQRSSTRRFPITSSIRIFDVAGRTSPTRRFTSISARPSARRPLCAAIRSRASAQLRERLGRFFFSPSCAMGLQPFADRQHDLHAVELERAEVVVEVHRRLRPARAEADHRALVETELDPGAGVEARPEPRAAVVDAGRVA